MSISSAKRSHHAPKGAGRTAEAVTPAPKVVQAPTPASPPAADSPARELQQQLKDVLETRHFAARRESWPGALKVAFVLGSSTVLWAGIIWAARSLLS